MTGQPVFALLHGGGHGSWVWNETTRALEAKGARCFLLDIPGCGTKRNRETIELGVEDVADELQADISGAGLSDIILVGHSQAGTMLPVMWQRQPALFRRLIYVSCCAPLPDQNVIEMMGRGVQGEYPNEIGWPLDPELFGSDVQRPIMFCNDMGEPQAEAFLAKLDKDRWPLAVTFATHWNYDHLADAPSTYVVCERDGILPPEWQHRFADRLHVQRRLSIDAGHQVMNTQPDALAEMLIAEGRL